jgi:hypothetical protein
MVDAGDTILAKPAKPGGSTLNRSAYHGNIDHSRDRERHAPVQTVEAAYDDGRTNLLKHRDEPLGNEACVRETLFVGKLGGNRSLRIML